MEDRLQYVGLPREPDRISDRSGCSAIIWTLRSGRCFGVLAYAGHIRREPFALLADRTVEGMYCEDDAPEIQSRLEQSGIIDDLTPDWFSSEEYAAKRIFTVRGDQLGSLLERLDDFEPLANKTS
jgi:hypothetical protein